jgi:8-oxo-dGTP diphosphatase
VHLVVVRHGKAGSRQDWDGPDELRPLSPAGHAQAEGLVELLAPYDIDRILSSPATRCVQTVEPLSRATGLPVEVRHEIGEGHEQLATRLLAAVAEIEQPTVLCTHGDIVPAILEWLEEEHGLALRDGPRWAKGSSWVLEVNGGRFASARYLGPASARPDPLSRSDR